MRQLYMAVLSVRKAKHPLEKETLLSDTVATVKSALRDFTALARCWVEDVTAEFDLLNDDVTCHQ